jgi:hypothetical protein
MITRYREQLGGAADGNNRIFTASHAPDIGSLEIFDDMEEAQIELVNGTAITLVTAPALNSQMFGTFTVTTADDIDLSTVADIKIWGEIKTSSEDSMIQQCLTAFSRYVLKQTNRAALNRIVALTELYNGNGSALMLLKNYPITELSSVKISGTPQIISTGYGMPGVSIGTDGMSLQFGYGAYGLFTPGLSNIEVAYSAGYADAPDDLAMAACEAVVQNYKRRQWVDLKSKSQGTQGITGTTSYRDWKFSPFVESVIQSYTRIHQI